MQSAPHFETGRRPRANDDTSDRARSLLPREHGAYAQLALPLLAALFSGRPSVAALLLTTAAATAFLAHEPARVLWGHRGSRAQRVDGARARKRVWMLGGATAVLGSVGLFLAPEAKLALAFVLPFVVLAGVLAARNADRTLLGETIAGAALPGLATPVAVAAGVAPHEAIAAWCIWGFSFALSTAAVRALTAREESERRRMPWLVGALFLLGGAALGGHLHIVLAAAPVGVASLAVVVLQPAHKHIKRIGWTFAGAIVLTAVSLVVHARS